MFQSKNQAHSLNGKAIDRQNISRAEEKRLCHSRQFEEYNHSMWLELWFSEPRFILLK